ncbi:MAG: GIY-YIG nuclease family protein [Melioribacteraceae bacterium]|nr:GIY-YIG nuclease family protein [Melioribacteraceae bacterium]
MELKTYYVYFLKSEISQFRYIGFTSNIKKRIKEHNAGLNVSTKAYRPFSLDAFIAVRTKEKAKELEKYFKTGSGIAFARKRILTYEASAK